MFRSTMLSLFLSSTLLVVACDSDSGPTPEQKAAAEKKAAEKKAQDEALAKRKAEREAKKKAKEEEERKYNEAVDAVAVVADDAKLPKDLDKACEAVGEAQDQFMQRHYTGDALEKWNSGKGTQLPMTKVQCTQGDSIKIAVCQKNAFDNAGADLKKAVPDLLRRCIEKYRKEGAGAPGAIKAKPGG